MALNITKPLRERRPAPQALNCMNKMQLKQRHDIRLEMYLITLCSGLPVN